MTRHGGIVLLAFAVALTLAACGGGGGGGGGEGGGQGRPVKALGWIGGGEDAWIEEPTPGAGSDVMPEPGLSSFLWPRDLCLDADGNVYVADEDGNRIVKWGPDGTPIGWIGGGRVGWQANDDAAGRGTDFGSIREPNDVCLDADGNLYVAERWTHRVSRWSPSGEPLGWIGGGRDGWQTSLEMPEPGFDLRSFRGPSGVAVAADGTIYVADPSAFRVTRWSADGVAFGWFRQRNYSTTGWRIDVATDDPDPRAEPGGLFVTDGLLYVAWPRQSMVGVYDVSDARQIRTIGSLDWPADVAVDAAGVAFVAEGGRHSVSRWSADGTFQGRIGDRRDGWNTILDAAPGSDPRSFHGPGGVALDADGIVHVIDVSNHRLTRWSKDGVALGWVGWSGSGWRTDEADGSRSARRFRQPNDLFLDEDGMLYVSDTPNRRVARWHRDGTFLGWIGGGRDGWQFGSAPDEGDSDLRHFDWPRGVWVRDGVIHVADEGNRRIVRWSTDGTLIDGFTAPLDGEPHSVCVDGDGVVYATWAAGVARWTASGSYDGCIGGGSQGWHRTGNPTTGGDVRSFHAPADIALDGRGRLVISDVGLSRIAFWSRDGKALGWIGGGEDGFRFGTVTRKLVSGDLVVSSRGAGPRSFTGPVGVWVRNGHLYASDDTRVCRWDIRSSPQARGWFGEGKEFYSFRDKRRAAEGTIDYLDGADGVAVDADGTVFVAESSNRRISRWEER